MRTIYLLIIVFLLACIISAEVYIHQVKGIGFFQAPAISSALWIIEWLLMLLVACLIGIAIGWQLRQAAVSKSLFEIQLLQQEQKVLVEKELSSREEAEQSRMKLARAQESFKEDFKNLSRTKEKIKEELALLQAIVESSKDETQKLQRKVEAQQKELELSFDNNSLLKNNLEKAQAENETLKGKLTKSVMLPAKDDLKRIVGIGPVIEKKLNDMGIYSFRQISEFAPLTIDEITKAIKFFPGRIERDNWVSQARNFEQEKNRLYL